MKIVLLGSTGRTGSAILRTALDFDHEVTAFARDPNKVSLHRSNLRLIQGNALDPQAIDQAIYGQQAVVYTLGSDRRGSSHMRSQITSYILSAMSHHAVRRIVVVLSSGVLDSSLAPKFTSLVTDNNRQLDLLRQSQLEWVAVCPPGITDEPFSGRYQIRVGAMPLGTTDPISKYDLADFVLRQLVNDGYLRQFVGIANHV